MSPEQDKQEEVHLQHEAEHTQHKEKVSVWGYLTILFAAAFLLLGLTLFMQIRNQNEANNDLTDSVNNLQSLGNLVDQNNALLEKNQDLQKQVDELEKTLSEAQAELKIQSSTSSEREQQLIAMDWLWRIQRACPAARGTVPLPWQASQHSPPSARSKYTCSPSVRCRPQPTQCTRRGLKPITAA